MNANLSADLKPQLSAELRRGVSKYFSMGLLIICLISVGLHLAWSIRQKVVLQDHVRDAIAHTLQEPIRTHDWVSMKRTLQAFSISTENAEICVRLPENTILEQPNCRKPEFKKYPLRLSSESFYVSVKIPILDGMALVGLPFIFASILLLGFASRYFTILSKKIKNDLDSLVDISSRHSFNYSELESAYTQIQTGIKLQSEQQEMQSEARIGSIATQVAHDIRSPLSVLRGISNDLSLLPVDSQNRVIMSIQRIEEIAEHLLSINKESKFNPQSNLESVDLSLLLQNVVTDKKVEFGSSSKVEIESCLEQEQHSEINRVMFKSIISNLINNAFDALKGKAGKITITLKSLGDLNIIEVSDNGPGITKEAQEKLFLKGFTTKANGNGIGLYSAAREISACGGKIDIETTIGAGTTVRICLPNLNSKKLAINNQNPVIVLIDDDRLIRIDWQSYFKSKPSTFFSFSTIDEFLHSKSKIPIEAHIYIDSNLGFNKRGEVESEKIALCGYSNLYLATGYQKEDILKPIWIKDICPKNPRSMNWINA